MKQNDWGSRVKLLGHAFDLAKGLGVHNIHITASTEEEAKSKLGKKLERHQDFLRKTEGHYQTKFDRVVS